MRTHFVNQKNCHRHGDLLDQYFQLRKQRFIDQLQWDVPHNRRYEFDQYDTPLTSYVLIEKDGACIAGARIMRSDTPIPNASYMVRDAYLGRLPGFSLPLEAPPPEPGPKLMEATRFLTRPGLGPREAIAAQVAIAKGSVRLARLLGYEFIIGIMPVRIYAMYRKNGINITELDPVLHLDGLDQAVGLFDLSGK